jgi:endonuclease/exonuclease/phosphatase family metal-dependent hydrolase
VRVVILAHVDVPKVGLVYFFVTHLSFVPLIQCRHVYELLRIVRSLDLDHLRPKIVVGNHTPPPQVTQPTLPPLCSYAVVSCEGDFNFFPDSEDPAAFFEQDWNQGTTMQAVAVS